MEVGVVRRPIRKYFEGERNFYHYASKKIPFTTKRVRNPFTIDVALKENSSDFKCSFSSQLSCYAIPCWGITPGDLFDFLAMDYDTMNSNFIEDGDDYLSRKCILAEKVIRLEAGEEKTFVLNPPQFVFWNRRLFEANIHHLVILMFTMEENIRTIKENSLFVQATSIYVPELYRPNPDLERVDNDEPVGSNIPRIVRNYVKLLNDRITGILKKTYDGSLFRQKVKGIELPVCLICCKRSVNTIIFPCLHRSVCSLCCFEFGTCPTCRGPINFRRSTGYMYKVAPDYN